MSENTNKQGFGLALTALIIMAVAFFVTFYLNQCIFGSIIALVAAILSTVAFIEARRANGPGRFTLTILVITILGLLFNILWTASASRRGSEQEIIIESPEDPSAAPEKDLEKKGKEMEELLEELEQDSI